MFVTRDEKEMANLGLFCIEKRPRSLHWMKLRSKSPSSSALPPSRAGPALLVGFGERSCTSRSPPRSQDWGRRGKRPSGRRMEKPSGPGSPRPTCRSRMGQGGAEAGWGRGGTGGTWRPHRPLRPVNDIPAAGAQARPRGSSAAHAPQAGRGRFARLPAPPRERRGSPGSPVRALARPRPRGCPAPGPGVDRPRAPLPPWLARSSSHRLLGVRAVGASGRGCWGNRRGSAASAPLRSLRSG